MGKIIFSICFKTDHWWILRLKFYVLGASKLQGSARLSYLKTLQIPWAPPHQWNKTEFSHKIWTLLDLNNDFWDFSDTNSIPFCLCSFFSLPELWDYMRHADVCSLQQAALRCSHRPSARSTDHILHVSSLPPPVTRVHFLVLHLSLLVHPPFTWASSVHLHHPPPLHVNSLSPSVHLFTPEPRDQRLRAFFFPDITSAPSSLPLSFPLSVPYPSIHPSISVMGGVLV